MFPQRGVSPFRRLSEHHPLKSLLPKRTAQQGPAPRPRPGFSSPNPVIWVWVTVWFVFDCDSSLLTFVPVYIFS